MPVEGSDACRGRSCRVDANSAAREALIVLFLARPFGVHWKMENGEKA